MKINLTLPTLTVLGLTIGISSISVGNTHHINSKLSEKSVAVVSQKRQFDLDADKTSIGRLKLNMNINKVRKILGTPLQQKQKVSIDDNCGTSGNYIVTFKYSKTEVSLLGKNPNSAAIENITTSNPSLATSEGIRVGDSIAKAKKVYAKYESGQIEGRLVYGTISTLSFKTNGDRITQISLNYDRCY
ncbi:hypothetical protein [Chamaesiphon polymorphus]|nr:hypothetical protein [Chamaesiphon polymorphus]